MSFEAYSVAVRLKLIDGVSSGLGLISRGMRSLSTDTDAARRNVTDLEARLQSIKGMALAGGALMGVGAFGLSLFEAPLKAAREYELAFTKFKTLNLGDAVNKQADQFARSANLMGISAKDLMTTMSESVGIFGGYAEAQKLAPRIAQINAANAAIFGGKIGAIDEGSARALAKFIDRRGGTKDDATFLRNLDLAEKMVTGSGGFIKFQDLDKFSQYGGTAFRSLSDAGILNMALLLQEQGGARAGTGLMSLYQNLVAGRTTKKAMAELADLGLGHLGYRDWGQVDGKKVRSLVMQDVTRADLLQSNPPEWMRTVLLPALQRKGITDEASVLRVVNDVLSNRTSSSSASIMTTQLLQMMRDANLAKGAMGYDDTIKAWKDDPNSKWADLTARWTDTLRELGLVVLPMAIKGLEGLTGMLRTVIDFSKEFPKFTSGIVLTGAALAGLAATGGALMLFRAGLSGLSLALGAGAVAGEATLLGALTGLLGPIGLAVAGVTALAVAMNLIKPDNKDDGKDHTGEHWERNFSGRGGSWEKNERIVGAHRGFPGTREHWTPDGTGGGRWEPTNFVAPTSGRPINVHTKVNLDGRPLAEVVSKHQAVAFNRSTSTGMVDLTLGVPSVGMRYTA